MSDDPSPILAVERLEKRYGDLVAVDGVSFQIDRGEVVGILGPNGAGKTTTIKSILGLIVPTAGRVELAGIDVHARPAEAYRHVGAMLEGARNVYWRLTVRENLAYFAALGGRSPPDDAYGEVLERFGLEAKADRPVNDLSRGQKQTVALACTLMRGTDLVFLDEPTLGLDVEASMDLRRELRRLADDEDITIVLSSHDMDVVEAVCDRVIILSGGQVVTDEPVDELVDLFRSRTYRLAVGGSVPAPVCERLDERFGPIAAERRGGRTILELTITDADALAEVLEVVGEAPGQLEGVESVEPDLEAVFLDVTNGEANGRTRPEATAPGGVDA
ncbi:MAG: ABC transporter ATP-binding protein [Halobacteriota archaeon]